MYAESSYQILGTAYQGDSPGIQAALAEVYGTDERPRCLCVERGIEMYVAQHAQLVIKRMPGTGSAHHPSCPSYEAPPGETGLGDLLGEAVIERGPERVEVRLDFPLSHVSVPRPAQAPSAPSQSVSAAQRRLSMRGLLHLLWDRAGFSRWSPRMEGKRSWFVIRKYLLEAAAEIDAKGAPLASRLFMPEQFRPDDAEGLKARRTAFFSALRLDGAGDHVPLVLLAEVKDLIERGDGYSMVLKHLPDSLLALDSTTGRQLARRFDRELLAKAQQPDTRLIVGCTIRPAAEGLGHADTLAMMAVTPEWLPFEHLLERALLVELVRQEKLRFEEIERIVVRSAFATSHAFGAFREPATATDAFNSLRHAVAAAAHDGEYGFRQLAASRFKNAAIVAFSRDRIHVMRDPELEKLLPDRWPGAAEIHTRDGRRFEKRFDYHVGQVQNPIDPDAVKRKFLTMTKVLGARRAARVVEVVNGLETVADITLLTQLLRPA